MKPRISRINEGRAELRESMWRAWGHGGEPVLIDRGNVSQSNGFV